MTILVTGAAGSIGAAVVPILRLRGGTVFPTDIDELDVRDAEAVQHWVRVIDPDVILHLAGAKHAPEGEDDPYGVCVTNTVGTQNVLASGRKVVLASTCKACDPETAYGASKLLAERMVLNASGVVVRYYNVRESGGNVFRLWEQIPLGEPIPVTDCRRYFISLGAAVGLTVAATLDLPSGRYTVDPGPPEWMRAVAARFYPGRETVSIPARRGDRRVEPLCARSEQIEPAPHGLVRIVGEHDSVPASAAVAVLVA